jgi:catechol 2,3-dioxygenase-like lactoylglutathione lyase family enzyme
MKNTILHTGATVADIEWHKKFLLETFSMTVLSDFPREGDWIDATTGLKGFQSQTVYMASDEYNKIEMFHIFHPEIVPVPLTYGSYLGISHIGIHASRLAEVTDQVAKRRFQLNFMHQDDLEGGFLVQDKSGLTWQLHANDLPRDDKRNAAISHIRIMVSDVNRSLPVYTNLLGLTIKKVESKKILLQDRNGEWLNAEAEIHSLTSATGQKLEICQYINLIPLPNPRKKINSLGLHHLAFFSDNAHTIYSDLPNFECIPLSEPQSIPMGPNKGGFVFYFFDPDGISLEILQTPNRKY